MFLAAGATVGLAAHFAGASGPFTYAGTTGSPIAPSTGNFSSGFDGVAVSASGSSSEVDLLDLGSPGFIATNDVGGTSGLTLGTLKLGNNVGVTDTIAGGTLNFASSGTLTQNGSGNFNISAPSVIAGTMVFNGVGTGATNISGTIYNIGGSNNVSFNGLNTTTFSGSNSFINASTTINSGTLALDYTAQANSKTGAGALTVGAGTLNIIGNASTNFTQTFSSTLINGGNTNVIIASGKTSLSLNTINESNGGAINFIENGAAGFGTIAVSNTNSLGILGGYAVVNSTGGSTSFATVASGLIVPNSSYLTSTTSGSYAKDGAGMPTDVSVGSTSIPSANSNNIGDLRFNSPGVGTLVANSQGTDQFLANDGILETSNVGDNSIFIGGPSGASGDFIKIQTGLFIEQYNTTGINSTMTIADELGGSGFLAKSGAGTLVLTNASNQYSGSTYLNGGLIRVGSTGEVVNTLVFNGGGLQTSAGFTVPNAVTLNAAGGTLDIPNGLTNTFTGAFGGTGGFTKADSGTAILSVLSSYTGPTYISGGVLQAGVAQSGSTGAFGTYSAVTLANVAGVALNLNNNNTTLGSITGGGTAGGNISLGTAQLTVGYDNTSPAAYAGIISGTSTAKLLKYGTGYLTLTGVNTYGGGTTINSGVLLANSPTASLGSGPASVSGGVLAGTGTTGAGVVTVNGGSISAGSGATQNDSIGVLNTGPEVWSSGTYAAKLGNNSTADLLVMPSVTPTSLTILLVGTPNTIYTHGETWVIAESTGGSSFNFSHLGLSTAGYIPSTGFTLGEQPDTTGLYTKSNELYVTFNGTTTPEPGSAVLLGMAAYPLLARRRRQALRKLDRKH